MPLNPPPHGGPPRGSFTPPSWWWVQYYYILRTFHFLGGISLVTLILGFSVCLFDISLVPKCVDYSFYAFDTLKGVGDKMLAWFIALVKEVFSRTGGTLF